MGYPWLVITDAAVGGSGQGGTQHWATLLPHILPGGTKRSARMLKKHSEHVIPQLMDFPDFICVRAWN
jgi:NifU-like protein involved in Fe-S cluster formation